MARALSRVDGVVYCILQVFPLHLATALGNIEAVRILLDAGAKVDVENSEVLLNHYDVSSCYSHSNLHLIPRRGESFGASALHIAAQAGFTDIVQLLGNFGADLNSQYPVSFEACPWHCGLCFLLSVRITTESNNKGLQVVQCAFLQA